MNGRSLARQAGFAGRSVCGTALAVVSLSQLAAAQNISPWWPTTGSVILGGGALGGSVADQFADRVIALAGGPDALIVIIPTATEGLPRRLPAPGPEPARSAALREHFASRGARNVVILHTYDRNTANSEDFVRILRSAKGVFFPGGRARVLDNTYHGTLLEREVRAVLARGGVLAGDSAGAITLGCFWVSWSRGVDTLGVVSKGLCALQRVTVTPHVRHIDGDEMTVELQKYYSAHRDVIGINISEGTALVLQGSMAQVIGAGGVTIFDATKDPGKPYVRLTAGATRDVSR